MKFHIPRNINVILVGFVLVLNVICFLTLGRATFSRERVYHLARQVLSIKPTTSTESVSERNVRPATSKLVTTPRSKLDTKTKVKIETIRRYLNESSSKNFRLPAFEVDRYLMVDPNRCRNVEKVDLVILVHTAPANLEKRQRMRDSFAKESLFLPFHIRIAFLLGKTKNSTLERILWMEHAAHNDTVMANFIDDYHNLTLKGVMGYRWVKDYCSNSKFVLKIDDDVLVNMYKLLYSFTGHMSGKKKSIFCNVWKKSTMGILRTGKWKVANNIFSNMTLFPYDYCSGFVVLISSDLMKPLYEAAKITPFFWIDDIYLFGMLPQVVGGVTYYNYALNSNVTMNDKQAIECTKNQGPKCPIFATIISPKSYWSYWNTIKDLYSPNSWKVEERLVE